MEQNRWLSRVFTVDSGTHPPFEPKVLEETHEYKIWIDGLGATRKDFKVLPTPGFVTRSWLEFPVKDRAGFLAMKKRFDATSPGRYVDPAHREEMLRRFRNRDYPMCWVIFGLFWVIRDWVGFETACTWFVDEPKLVDEMMEFLKDYACELIDRALADVSPTLDCVIISEDMAYKTASMISPAMVRRFMLPRYREIVARLRRHGVENIFCDCDGHVDELIPIWLDAGINGAYPIEIAAGCDPVKYRREYGKDLRMIGGIDKREIAKGPRAIEREVMGKVPFLLESGGYAPGIDHACPPDVSLDNFRHFIDFLRKVGGRT